jgi:hypothetical protein
MQLTKFAFLFTIMTLFASISCRPTTSSNSTHDQTFETNTGSRMDALFLDPNKLELGRKFQRSRSVTEVKLKNNSNKQIIIQTIETSCDCLTVHPSSMQLEPGQIVTLQVILDLSNDPDFKGGLQATANICSDNPAYTCSLTVITEVTD